MRNDDSRQPTLAQRQIWMCQAVAAACSITVITIGLCVANVTLGWPTGLMPIVAVLAIVSWIGAIALAAVLSVAKMVDKIRDELLEVQRQRSADQRQRREDQIRAEIDADNDVSVLDDAVSVHRMRR